MMDFPAPLKVWLIVIVLFGLGDVGATAAESVPFVGCPTDGAGFNAQQIPTGDPHRVELSHPIAQKLAWYEDSGGAGVLAPRGWTCSAGYGSGGHHIHIKKPGQYVQMIAVNTATSEFSGRYEVARLLNQFFRNGHEQFIASAIDDWKSTTGQDGASQINAPRSVTDQVHYRTTSTLDFVTPAGTFGLGTISKTPSPYQIVGQSCVTEDGASPEVTVIGVALPDDEQTLARAIVKNWGGCDQ